MSTQTPKELLDAVVAWRHDHESLKSQVTAVSEALKAGDGERAALVFELFRSILLEHLKVEEQLAFPLAEKLLKDQAGPIRSLRSAHMGYRQDLEQISEQIARGHYDAAATLYAAFIESFKTHERLEDQLLDLIK